MGYKYIDHDDENKSKKEGFGERPQDNYNYIDHDIIDLDDEE